MNKYAFMKSLVSVTNMHNCFAYKCCQLPILHEANGGSKREKYFHEFIMKIWCQIQFLLNKKIIVIPLCFYQHFVY